MMKRLLPALWAMVLGVAVHAADAKYIFYFIGDGMGNGHVMSALSYGRTVLGEPDPLIMATFPVAGICTTYSASSPVTDSAAAGTALSTGTKTTNNMLGQDPDSAALTSIAVKLHDAGYGVGILTTVCADDATPGAFYAHQPSRRNYYEIGIEAAHSGYEFIAGSDLRGIKGADGRYTDLLQTFADENVAVVRGVEALRAANSRRVVLLDTDTVTNWHVGFTIDSVAGRLTLPVMTAEAIAHLQAVSPDAFFMMVEGGNIDYAGHANDGGTAIKEILKFDEALRVAYAFYQQHPDDTLIIVTADHDTGGMSLGNQAIHYNANLHLIDQQRIAKDTFSDEVKAMLKSRRLYTWPEMREYLTEKLGFWTAIPISERDTQLLEDSFRQTFIDHDSSREQTALYNKYPGFVADVFGLLQDYTGIGWTTLNHTGNPVHVYAIGQGAELFKGLNDNAMLPRSILRAAGVAW